MRIALIAAAAIAIPAAPAQAQDMDMDTDTDVEVESDSDYVSYSDTDGRYSLRENQTATFRTSDGMEEEVEFRTDGTATIRGTDGTSRLARYEISDDRLCIDEDDDLFDRCYGYNSSLFNGSTYRVTDTRGVTSDVTFERETEDTDRRYLSARYGERG
jgi:hypothetical protein